MKTQQHIAFKVLALALLFAVLLPSAIKFTHVFENHIHEVCSDNTSTHIHEIDLDCEFYKFKLNNQYQVLFNNYNIPNKVNYFKINKISYKFLNNHQQLPFSLRGPPTLV